MMHRSLTRKNVLTTKIEPAARERRTSHNRIHGLN
jgi:hypothetical protein